MTAKEFHINTPAEGFLNITRSVRETIEESGVRSGIVVIWCAHTTAGITINENADPDVVDDMLLGLAKAYPDRPEFRHMEGISSAPRWASARPSRSKTAVCCWESGRASISASSTDPAPGNTTSK